MNVNPHPWRLANERNSTGLVDANGDDVLWYTNDDDGVHASPEAWAFILEASLNADAASRAARDDFLQRAENSRNVLRCEGFFACSGFRQYLPEGQLLFINEEDARTFLSTAADLPEDCDMSILWWKFPAKPAPSYEEAEYTVLGKGIEKRKT